MLSEENLKELREKAGKCQDLLQSNFWASSRPLNDFQQEASPETILALLDHIQEIEKVLTTQLEIAHGELLFQSQHHLKTINAIQNVIPMTQEGTSSELGCFVCAKPASFYINPTDHYGACIEHKAGLDIIAKAQCKTPSPYTSTSDSSPSKD